MNILLRMALASSATHMLRSTPPTLALKVTTFIDDFTRRLLVDRYSIPIDTPDGNRAIEQCYLRLGKGGLGIPRAAETAPIAFWAGFAQASHLLVRDDHTALLESEWLASTLRDVHASPELAAAGAALAGGPERARPVMPAAAPSPLSVARFYQSPPLARHRRGEAVAAGIPMPAAQELQKRLQAVVSARRFQAFVAGRPATNVVVSRLKATEGIGGSAWLSTCPTTSFTIIRDVDFLKAVRLRLGLLPVVNFPVARCPACKKRPLFADAPLTC
jgi:hypothetical protein